MIQFRVRNKIMVLNLIKNIAQVTFYGLHNRLEFIIL